MNHHLVFVHVIADVASRGLDIKNLPIVVNYDFPSNIQQYVHRIGRCGRKEGSSGYAFSFITRNYMWMAPTVVRLLRSCKQAVDPNLKRLADESGEFDDDTVSKKSTNQPESSKQTDERSDATPALVDNATDDVDFFFPDSDDDDDNGVTLSGKRRQ